MKLSIVSLVLAGLVSFTATAHADEIDAALDMSIGLPTTVDATVTTEAPAPTPHRDPSTVGATLRSRRTVDLAFADDDAGHRIDVTPPAPVSSRRSHHHGHRNHGNFASR